MNFELTSDPSFSTFRIRIRYSAVLRDYNRTTRLNEPIRLSINPLKPNLKNPAISNRLKPIILINFDQGLQDDQPIFLHAD